MAENEQNAWIRRLIAGIASSATEALTQLDGADKKIANNLVCEADDLQRPADRVPLPDPKWVRRIIRERQMRSKFFDGDLFADPVWDILLDLTVARAEHTRISVSSLCIAAGVPATTALRWIGALIEAGLVERFDDVTDRRRKFVTLTDSAADAIARYFAALASDRRP